MKLNKNEEKTINELLENFKKEAIAGNSTEHLKAEVIKFVSQYGELKSKAAYSKGYNAGKIYTAMDDWQYDAGDSRG